MNSYQREKGERKARFNEEQKILRRFLKDIKIHLVIIMWGVVITGAVAVGIFARLLFD